MRMYRALLTLVQKSLKPHLTPIRTFTATTTAPKEKWELFAGILVERHPIVTKTQTQLEVKFQALLTQMEFENSLKSNFELLQEKEQLLSERIKKGEAEIDLDESTSKQTTQDLKDAYIEELKKFKLAPRLLETDNTKDYQSVKRDLEDILYLLVEHKLGDQVHLLLPQGQRQEGETLRQTAERVLKERCGESIKVTFYGNAPCGFYKYKYPASQRKESVGAKVFFFRSGLKTGNVDQKIAKKFEWVDKDDLGTKLPGKYSESIHRFLL